MMELRFLIGSIVAIGLFMTAHLITAVWWASQVTAAINAMKSAINELRSDIKGHDGRFYEKVEAKEQIIRRDKEINDVRVDLAVLRKEFNECQVKSVGRKA
jgi:hypothetical protein